MTPRPFLALALVALLAGCSPAAEQPDPSVVSTQQALDVGRRLAQCARDHGYPDMPDPQIEANGDRLVWPGDGRDVKEQLRALQEQVPECKAIMDEMAALGTPRSAEPPSAADMEKLKAFAKCMRDHGIDGFPDPKADGTFPLVGTPLENEGKSERVLTAMDACKGIYDKKIAVS
ncbi:hypothetical protein [Dactylosporangium sp. NPDC000521]|uniref:hypothetical protein n=1 Tax=Dactylosporangium sp. NPDC000521 TaxID=3363975 RepID=UPI003677ED08